MIREILMEITRACNLGCLHCYASKNTKNELTTAEWFAIIDKLKNFKSIRHCVILGGEPTLRRDFEQILQYAIDSFPDIIVETSGVTNTNLSNYDCTVSVSFESWNKLENDAIRGKTMFEGKETSVFELALRKLRAITNPKIARFSLYSDSDVMKCLIMAEMYGAHAVFVPLIPVGNASELAYRVPSAQKILESFNIVKEFDLRVRGNSKEVKHLVHTPQYYIWNSDLRRKHLRTFCNDCSVCPAGTRRLFIDAEGNAKVCPFIPQYNLGNLLDKKVNERYIYKQLNLFNEIINQIPLKENCINCKINKVCNGGCKVMILKEKKKTGEFCPLIFQAQQIKQKISNMNVISYNQMRKEIK